MNRYSINYPAPRLATKEAFLNLEKSINRMNYLTPQELEIYIGLTDDDLKEEINQTLAEIRQYVAINKTLPDSDMNKQFNKDRILKRREIVANRRLILLSRKQLEL